MDPDGDPLHARRPLDLDRNSDASRLIRILTFDGQSYRVDTIGVETAGEGLRIKTRGSGLRDRIVDVQDVAVDGLIGNAADDRPRRAHVERPQLGGLREPDAWGRIRRESRGAPGHDDQDGQSPRQDPYGAMGERIGHSLPLLDHASPLAMPRWPSPVDRLPAGTPMKAQG